MRQRLSRSLSVGFVLLTLTYAGCGGDDDSETDGVTAESGRTTPNAVVEKDRRDEKGQEKAGESPESRAGTQGKENGRSGHRRRPKSLREALARLSEKRRQLFLRRLLKPILVNVGIKGSALTLSADLRTLTIDVPTAKACNAKTLNEKRIVRNVRRLLPFLRSVPIVVEGGERLTVYFAAHCEKAELPGASGRVVLKKDGYGSYSSRPFKIRSKRWTIEFSQQGDFFSIFVAKGRRGRKYDPNTVLRRGRGSGRKTYKGPGTFRLNVNGSGDWSVRVRDGG